MENLLAQLNVALILEDIIHRTIDSAEGNVQVTMRVKVDTGEAAIPTKVYREPGYITVEFYLKENKGEFHIQKYEWSYADNEKLSPEALEVLKQTFELLK